MKRSGIVALAWVMATAVTSQAETAAKTITVPLQGANGMSVGEAKLTQIAKGVKIELTATNLSPGTHAFHFHETGKCAPPDFKSAGSHFGTKKQQHGFDVSKGPHSGDMPNIIVGSDGIARTEVINSHVTLGPGPNSLLKRGGTAIVIHAQADDYKSQPAGNAGDRVACGVISETPSG